MHHKRKKYELHAECNSFNQKEVSEKIEAHFSKLFTFVKPGRHEKQWVLPKSEELYQSAAWCNEVTMKLKQELNSVKDLLSDKDIILWRQHTQDVNIASQVVPYIRNKIKAEFCTQAWCKFYEILCTFCLVPRNTSSKSLTTVHLCEAPGAFVAALNHYLVLNYPHLELLWLATTLNPYYEGNELGITIPDDRFILPTFEHWDFGEDNTGNLFSSPNRSVLLERAKSNGLIHLVTADGSIDCQDNPSEQESIVAKLHLVEVVTALRLLAQSGNLIIKLFTCFEHASICLLYLLNCAFHQVHVFKPGTSKRGNSEVYVIGLNYVGANEIENHLLAIETYLEKNVPANEAMFECQQLPNSFIQQMIACCTYFKNLQIEAIREHINWFECIDADQKRLLGRTKSLVSQMFVKKYALEQIPYETRVLKNKELSTHYFQNKQLREGSLNERKKVADLPWHRQLVDLEEVLKNAATELGIVAQDVFLAVLPSHVNQLQVAINILSGKEFSKCLNSHFCNTYLLRCWNQIGLSIRESGVEIARTSHFEDSKLFDLILNHLTELPSSSYQFLAHHLSCEILADRLQQACTFKDIGSEVVTRVHLTDLRYAPNSWTPLYNSQNIVESLGHFYSVLETSHIHDTLLLVVDMLITRVEVGLLYILNQSFEKVILLSVSTQSGSSLELVLCKNYVRPIPPSNLEILKSIQRKPCGTVLEILPISNLFDEPFFTTTFSFNCYVLVQRATYLINRMKCTIPTND